MTRRIQDNNIKSPSVVFERHTKTRASRQSHSSERELSGSPLGIATRSLQVRVLAARSSPEKQKCGKSQYLSRFSLSSEHISKRGIIHSGVIVGVMNDIVLQHIEELRHRPLTGMLQVKFLRPAVPGEPLLAQITPSSYPSTTNAERKRRESCPASLDGARFPIVRLVRIKPTLAKQNSGKRGQKVWVQGDIKATRNGKSITIARAKALLILYNELLDLPSLSGPSHRKRKHTAPQMSQELWDMVVDYLPSLNGRHAARAFKFELTERHQRHSGIWSKIFKDEIWTSIATRQGLNPVLVGDDLHSLFHDSDSASTYPVYLTLLTGDRTGNLRHDRIKLIASLRPHHWNEDNEIVFDESNITLNIIEPMYNSFIVTCRPEKLFTCQYNGLRSASLYWKDSYYALRTIGSQDIIGIGEHATSLENISLISGVTLTHPKETPLKQRHQQCFQHPTCPPVYPICPPGYTYNGDNILGWGLDEDMLG